MSNGYSFFIRRMAPTAMARENIETAYNCIYRQFQDLAFGGEVKNIYTEDYAEMDGARVYIPNEPKRKTYECKLQLLFDKPTCQSDVRRFVENYMGTKFEYQDSFRNITAHLIMTKRPTIKEEKLYTESPYMLVEFTFTNIDGIVQVR